MTLRALLEEFERPSAGAPTPPSGERPELTAVRSEGFEAGYASGWEDASKAAEAARQRIDAELERSVQDLGFTYHEAVTRVRNELHGFICQIIESFLPALIPDLVAETIRDELTRIGDEMLSAPVELVTSAESASIFEALSDRDLPFDLDHVVEEGLPPGQAYLRIARRERLIDFAPLLDTLSTQFAALDDEFERTGSDG